MTGKHRRGRLAAAIKARGGLVIAYVHTKGGVGKSTLSWNMAYEFAAWGLRVLLINDDPQGTIVKATAVRRKLGHPDRVRVVNYSDRRLWVDLPDLAGDADVVVIDVQGRDGNAARSAILAAGLAHDEQGRPRGLVLLPITPSPADVWETSHTNKLLLEAAPKIQQRTGRDLWSRVRLVMNRADPKEVISAATAEALEAHPAALLDTVVQRRTIYPTVWATGQAVCEIPASRGVEAATEIATLTTDVTRIALKEN